MKTKCFKMAQLSAHLYKFNYKQEVDKKRVNLFFKESCN